MSITLNVIGGGNMARAIIEGAIHGGILKNNTIAVAEPDDASRTHFENLGCSVVASADELQRAPYVLLAVKPQVFQEVVKHVRGDVIYSIMAGVSISHIATETGNNKVVRVMPNLPCSLGVGATGLTVSQGASKVDAELANALFSAIGIVVEVEESLMDAITAVSGSGPAYVFLLAEAMIQGAIDAGLDQETANTLVRQTIKGAAAMLSQDNRSATAMREAVTSKGGTTAAAIESMQSNKVSESIARGVVAARNRGRELGE